MSARDLVERAAWIASGLLVVIMGFFSVPFLGMVIYGYGRYLGDYDSPDFVLVSGGILGLTAVLIFSIYWLWKLARKVRRSFF